MTYRSCPVIENLLKSLSAKQRTFLGLISKDAVQCLLAFLAFIVNSPPLFSQFKTFINSLMALVDVAIAAVQLFIAQVAVSIDIIGAIISPFQAAIAQVSGFLNIFPFGEFLSCPPIAKLAELQKKLTQGALNYISNIPPGNKIKMVLGYIKKLQWQLERLQKFKQNLLDTLEQLKAIKLLFQAIVDALEQCFKDIRRIPS